MRLNLVLSLVMLSQVFVSTAWTAEKKDTYTIKWALAHQPARVFEQAANEFSKIVGKKSNGAIKVEIVRTHADGSPIMVHEAYNMLTKGDIQMSQTYSTFLGNYNKNMWILDLPFLFKSHEHASKVLDGAIGRKILDGFDAKSDVIGLAFTYSGGYRVIPSRTKPFATFESIKGQRIGVVSDSPVAQAYLREIGAVPVPVQDVQVLEAKASEGFETTYARLDAVVNDDVKFLNETEHTLFLTSILVEKNFFNKLPADLQKVVREAALEVAKFERNVSIKDNKDVRDKLVSSKKAQLVKMDAANMQKMKDAALPVYKKFSQILDNSIIQDIQKQAQ